MRITGTKWIFACLENVSRELFSGYPPIYAVISIMYRNRSEIQERSNVFYHRKAAFQMSCIYNKSEIITEVRDVKPSQQ